MPVAHELDAVLVHLDYLRAPGDAFYQWHAGERQLDGVVRLGWVAYSGRVRQFIAELYSCGLILEGFDWPGWQEEAAKYVVDPALLTSADADTCAKLLTVHVRKERFCDGHLCDVLDSGHMAAIVGRLKELRDAAGSPSEPDR